MSRLSTVFHHQANMVNRSPPEYYAPPIAGTTELLQQVLAQNQELMWLISTKYGKTDSKNTNRPSTPSTGPRQGQPCHPMPVYFDKYFWTHWQGSHKGFDWKSKSPGNKYRSTIDGGIERSNYGCTEWRFRMVPKVATNDNRNILLKSSDITLVPPNLISYKHAVLNKSLKAIILKSDTGATGNYVRGQDTIILKNPGPTTTGPRVRLTKNSIIQPTLFGHPPIQMLPSKATQAHAYPNLKSASLLSILQLCDSNCSALFTKKDVTIFNSENTPVLNGTRNTSDGLWDVIIETSHPKPPITAIIIQQENSVLRLDKKKSELASCLHTAEGCPKRSTFIQVINNGNFITWPGLTSKIISKHIPLSLTTLEVHFRQDQKNIRSTNKIATKDKPGYKHHLPRILIHKTVFF